MMKRLLVLGDIRTQKAVGARAEAMVLHDNKIAFVGTSERARAHLGEEKPVVLDYGQKVVLPGFIDSHIHFMAYGMGRLKQANLMGCSNLPDLVDRLKLQASKTETGWIEGRGFDQQAYPRNEWPTRALLDTISTSRPMIITRVCGHAVIANSAALSLLTEEQLQEGNAETGLFTEVAIGHLRHHIPRPTKQEQEAAVLEAADVALSQGITAVGTLLDTADQLGAYIRLEKENRLPIRMTGMPPYATINNLKAYGIQTGFGSDYVKLGGAKLFSDGSLGARTALMAEAYSDAPGVYGERIYAPDDLTAKCIDADSSGFQIVIHAIGDQANRETLAAICSAMGDDTTNPLRHRVEHISVLSDDLVEQIVEKNIICAIQPQFVTSDTWTGERIGAARSKWAYAFRMLWDRGVCLALGSDCPVEVLSSSNVISAAIHRSDWSPSEKLTLDEALYGYTYNSAFSIFRDDIIGSLEPGKMADFIVFDCAYDCLGNKLAAGIIPCEVWTNGLRVR
ncbi:MAG: amidohydrolase [Armatimonadota bacterium]